MTAGLTYWRCPDCRTEIVAPANYVPIPDTDHTRALLWDLLPITAARCEQMVEAHEGKHLGGGA